MKYSPEYIAYVQKYPFKVLEDFCNGIKNEIVFPNKDKALIFIEIQEMKSKRTKYTLVKQELNPEYL